MDPLPHPQRTRSFGRPANWDEARDGPCGTLDIADIVTPERYAAMQSLWRPSAEDLNKLNRGGAIALWIYGTTHPVVAMAAIEPEEAGIDRTNGAGLGPGAPGS